jgi:cytoskeletal protein CcmA (bactofilin family)
MKSANLKTLKVNGDTALSNLTINGTHSLNGSNTISENLDVVGKLNVKDDTTLGNLTINGTYSLNGSNTISENLDVGGKLNVKDDTTLGNLTINGNNTISGNLDVRGNLNVNGILSAKKIVCDILEVKEIIYNGNIMKEQKDIQNWAPFKHETILKY